MGSYLGIKIQRTSEMNVRNRNLFVTNPKCGVEEKQMDREALEYWLLILFPKANDMSETFR